LFFFFFLLLLKPNKLYCKAKARGYVRFLRCASSTQNRRNLLTASPPSAITRNCSHSRQNRDGAGNVCYSCYSCYSWFQSCPNLCAFVPLREVLPPLLNNYDHSLQE
jgi:hypothetical protein